MTCSFREVVSPLTKLRTWPIRKQFSLGGCSPRSPPLSAPSTRRRPVTVIRPSQFADFQANVALALAKRLGGRRATSPPRSSEHLDLDGRLPSTVEVSGPGFINLRCATTGSPTRSTTARRRPARRRRVQPTAEHPDRLLRAQRGQGDARRPPAHHHRRRRARPHPGVPRPPRDPAEPHRRLGHAVRHADRAPARRRRGLRRGRPAASSDPNAFYQAARAKFDGDADVRRPAPGARVVALQGGDAETLRLWQRARRAVQGLLQPDLPQARRHADRRRPGRGEHYNDDARPASATSSRPRGPGGRQRRRAVRVPRRLHRP